MSIGQFVVQVTPIQIARAYAAIANGGYLVTPYLVKKDKENIFCRDNFERRLFYTAVTRAKKFLDIYYFN